METFSVFPSKSDFCATVVYYELFVGAGDLANINLFLFLNQS